MTIPARKSRITWLQVEGPLQRCGHGVQFHHDDLSPETIVAFVDGFGWLHHPGSRATVHVVEKQPTIDAKQWSRIATVTREAVCVFLSDPTHLNDQFRYGPVHIWING